MALVDKYATPMARLKVVLQGLSASELELVLRFAGFLANEQRT